jgi:lipid-A-disaccharide synthase
MLDSLGLIRRVYPSAKAIVAQAPSVNERTYQGIEKSYAWTSEGTTLQRVPDRVRDCIKASDIAMVASGTLTLEVACLGVPMVIVYAMHPVDFWIAKKLVQVPDIGLANIVAGKRIVPELIQDQASAQNIARATLTLIDDPIRMEGIKRDLLAIAARLGPAGASALVAKRLMEILVTGSHRREGQTISSTGRRFARSTVSLAATEFET